MDRVCRAYENLLTCLKSTFGESQCYAFCCEHSQCCERSGCCVFLLVIQTRAPHTGRCHIGKMCLGPVCSLGDSSSIKNVLALSVLISSK